MTSSIKYFSRSLAGAFGKLLCLGVVFWVASCTASPAVPPPVSPAPAAPVPARVLLLVPESFERFVYVSFREEGEVRHRFGVEATDQIRALLGRYYSRVSLEVTGSEAEAMDRVSAYREARGGYRDFELVAVPRFVRVEAWQRRYKHGFDVDLQVEFFSTLESKVTKLVGHGESEIGAYATSTPLEAGRLALEYAVSAIGDGIYSSRDLRAP